MKSILIGSKCVKSTQQKVFEIQSVSVKFCILSTAATVFFAMSRPDFRSANQIRPPSCSLGEVTEASGSCHFSQGNTEAIASVVS